MYIDLINPNIKCAMLMKVYLLDPDLFLEPSVSGVLKDLIYFFLTNRKFTSYDKIPELSFGFFSFFQKFLDQFVATSYGDTSFAQLLLPFLRMEYGTDYRATIFSDLYELMHFFQNTAPLPDVKGYLYPLETDPNMLHTYKTAVCEGRLTPHKTYFIYWIAIHHLSCFIWNESESAWLREQFLMYILTEAQQKSVIYDICNYHAREDGSLPTHSYETLADCPPNRIARLQKLNFFRT